MTPIRKPRTAFVRCWMADGTIHEGTILNPERDYLTKIDRRKGQLSFVFDDGRGLVVACADIKAFYVGKENPWIEPRQQRLVPS